MKKILLVTVLSFASVQVFAANGCSSAIGNSNSCCSVSLVTARLANVNVCQGGTASATSCTDTSMGVACSNGTSQNISYPNISIHQAKQKK